jgi:hypothetical protein
MREQKDARPRVDALTALTALTSNMNERPKSGSQALMVQRKSDIGLWMSSHGKIAGTCF